MNFYNGQFPSIEQAVDSFKNSPQSSRTQNTKDGATFADIFANKKQISPAVAELRFSKHASGRLNERNINLTDAQMTRLNAGMQAAKEKGVNESLVMVDQLAFIVNVKNQTVITALDGSDSSGNVFTNIDGAVIA